MRASSILQLMAVSVLLFSAISVQPASATMSSGGMFDKIDGPYFGKGATRSRLGRTTRRNSYSSSGTVKKYRTNYAYGGGYKVGPRPRKWCGWWMRTQKGGGPKFNVAWNWRHYGRPTSPQIGAVVVWRHHVGIITGRAADGRWIVTSGNDGGRVRSRARSVRGAVFRI